MSTLTNHKTNLQMSATARRDHPTIPFFETEDDLAYPTAEENRERRPSSGRRRCDLFTLGT